MTSTERKHPLDPKLSTSRVRLALGKTSLFFTEYLVNIPLGLSVSVETPPASALPPPPIRHHLPL